MSNKPKSKVKKTAADSLLITRALAPKQEVKSSPVKKLDPDRAPVNCYGYSRVSTIKQVKEGDSLEFQKKAIEKYAADKKYNLIHVFEDRGISGSEKARDLRVELDAVLRLIAAGEVLIVYAFTRLTRSVKNFLAITAQLEQKGAYLQIMQECMDTSADNPYGNFSGVMWAALSQLELDMTKKRIEDIRQERLENGQFVGKVPYGWIKPDKKSEPIEVLEEQKIIKYIFELALSTNEKGEPYTYYSIAEKLNTMQVKPPKRSAHWRDTNIKRILNRKTGPALDLKQITHDITQYQSPQTRGIVDDTIKPPPRKLYQVGLNFY
jgi:DNA invertase Pin-like site-specific DNA recombinase